MHAAIKKRLRYTLMSKNARFLTDGEPVPGSTQHAVSLYLETPRLLFWLQTFPALPYNVKLLTVYVCKIIEFAKKSLQVVLWHCSKILLVGLRPD
jgi:hypothetical protein